MEKWCSPFLTTISRDFCNEEFVLDTGDLIKDLEKVNELKLIENENVNLFTLDVEKLYPSIRPELALQAISETLAADRTIDRKTKTAIEQFIKLSFENSYVAYQNDCYKPKVGIPTGGSLSRQIADIFLHWILFIKMTPNLTLIQAIRFWRRFIDDCVGLWRGSRRSFDNFIKQLNAETMKYGIKFSPNDIQFGKSVHVLDLWVYLTDQNLIQYRSYTKPTDSKRYLNPKSFHPKSVFNSVPFSQLLRTLRNNSSDDTRTAELNKCIEYFVNSGYDAKKVTELKEKAINHIPTNTVREENDTLIFPVHFFNDLSDFKAVVHSLKDAFLNLIGDTRVMLAVKKGSSIGNNIVRNKQLSLPNSDIESQQCNGRGCRQCPQVFDKDDLMINGKYLRIPRNLNCKSENVIYMWVCKLCYEKEVYFGRTTQECHDRSSGHRGCFNNDKWEKSALSMHAREVHNTSFSLNIFAIAVIKKVSSQSLRREEYRHVEKYQTKTL